MPGSLMSLAGAVTVTGALLVGGAGVANAEPTSTVTTAVTAPKAKKVKVTAKGGAKVRIEPYAQAHVVAHLNLGATVVLAGPTVSVHGWLWLQLGGGGWICARDVGALQA